MSKYARAFSPVLTLSLVHFYTNVVEPFKPRNPIETIACLWINRLREVKGNQHYNGAVLQTIINDKPLGHLLGLLKGIHSPKTEEEKELRRFILFFYQIGNEEIYQEFLGEAFH
nr:MAG TPA: hypothetical protein [Caudoviricetes sp.]